MLKNYFDFLFVDQSNFGMKRNSNKFFKLILLKDNNINEINKIPVIKHLNIRIGIGNNKVTYPELSLKMKLAHWIFFPFYFLLK